MSFNVDDNIDFSGAEDAFGSDAEEALNDVIEFVLHESNKIVPFEEGTLKGTGDIDQDGLEATISYNTLYAVYQHERCDLSHDPGRECKYLEKAIKRNKDRAKQYLKQKLGGIF